MKFECDYCHEKRTIVSFIPDGKVPGISMNKFRPTCRPCIDAPAIDGKPREQSIGENDVGTDDDYPF